MRNQSRDLDTKACQMHARSISVLQSHSHGIQLSPFKQDTSPPIRFVLKGCVMTKASTLRAPRFLPWQLSLTSGAAAQPAAHVLPKVAKVTVNAPVTLTDNGDSWTLDNGIVKVTVPKRDGNLSALVYHGVEHPDPRSILGTDALRHRHRKGDHRPGDQRRRTRGGLRQRRQFRRHGRSRRRHGH